jgi:hypothetical protein
MLSEQLRCVVVETDGGDDVGRPQRRGYRDLLPWADPYIAQLLLRHQLQMDSQAAAAGWNTVDE